MIRKLLTPFVHAAFLFPLTAIAMASIEVIAQNFDLRPDYIRTFYPPYLFLMIVVLVISGLSIFWVANILMRYIEKNDRPNFFDHVRQTFFYYIIAGLIVFAWLRNGFIGGEDDVYYVTFISYSVLSVFVNCIFLVRMRKTDNRREA